MVVWGARTRRKLIENIKQTVFRVGAHISVRVGGGNNMLLSPIFPFLLALPFVPVRLRPRSALLVFALAPRSLNISEIAAHTKLPHSLSLAATPARAKLCETFPLGPVARARSLAASNLLLQLNEGDERAARELIEIITL